MLNSYITNLLWAEANSPHDSVPSVFGTCAGDPDGELPGGAGNLLPPGGGGNKPKPAAARGLVLDDDSDPSFF